MNNLFTTALVFAFTHKEIDKTITIKLEPELLNKPKEDRTRNLGYIFEEVIEGFETMLKYPKEFGINDKVSHNKTK